MTYTEAMLDFIPSMARELPALVMGEPTTVDRLMLATSVCGWITDYAPGEGESWVRVLGDTRTHGVLIEADVYCKDNPCVSIVEYENKCIRNAISFEGCTAEELADVGRVFLNAAIAARRGGK
ncbi:hypothetical protein CIP107521_00692 [Corynebacterium diphtheriae]|nr:hypothetical protein CIP107521_00692 [Corynebacterium diphtheriae]